MTSSIFQRVQEIANGFHLDPSVTVELLDFGYEVAFKAYARGCADQHERTKAEARGLAVSEIAKTGLDICEVRQRLSSGELVMRGIVYSTADRIAAAIEKMERPV